MVTGGLLWQWIGGPGCGGSEDLDMVDRRTWMWIGGPGCGGGGGLGVRAVFYFGALRLDHL